MYTDDPFIYENGSLYLMVVSTFSLFSFITVVSEKVLQATGNALFPMIFNTLGAVVNIILDPILIFGLFGAPELGVLGAAVATVTGQCCSMIVALFMVFHYDHHVHISYRNFKFRLKTINEIYVVGVPSMVMMSIGAVMVTCLNAILIRFTEIAVAVLGIYFRLNSFVFMPLFGMSQGMQPIMGYSFGARNKERLMSTYWYGLKMGCIIMAIGTAIFWLFTEQLLMLFSATPEVLEIGVPALRVISICFVPAAFTIISTSMFQALAHGFLSMFISLIRQLILIVPLAYILSNMFGVEAAWFCYPIAEVAGFTLTFIFCRYVYNKDIKPLE